LTCSNRIGIDDDEICQLCHLCAPFATFESDHGGPRPQCSDVMYATFYYFARLSRNVGKAFGEVRDGLDFEWVRTHTFRKTTPDDSERWPNF
jgi:hypothetical protein